MLADLKFVQGAVSKKDYQPALTHFLIKDGRVTGYDGTIALSSPIDIDIDAAPKAVPFIKAIERCTHETTAIALMDSGRLRLKSGKFKCTIECTDEMAVLSEIKPEGDEVPTSERLVEAMRVLEPFIATDASRPWATGILLRGFSAYATNNIIIAQYWLGEGMHEINLPYSAIKELTRIGQTPERIQISQNSATFHFAGGRWMRTQLLDASWPDVDRILEAAFEGADLQPIPEGLFDAVDIVSPFSDKEKNLRFHENLITTSLEGEAGAGYEVQGIPDHGTYAIDKLTLLRTSVQKIDFSRKPPNPCPFTGQRLRGVMLGRHDQ